MAQIPIPTPGPRGPGRLIVITHQMIADLAGLAMPTVRTYASAGQFDQHDLDSTMTFINHHRKKRGWTLIGQPAQDSEEKAVEPPQSPVSAPASGYNPLNASFTNM